MVTASFSRSRTHTIIRSAPSFGRRPVFVRIHLHAKSAWSSPSWKKRWKIGLTAC